MVLESLESGCRGRRQTGIVAPGPGTIARMLDHAITAVRRHNRQLHLSGIRDLVLMRAAHCTRVKCSDLVVVCIGSDKGLRRVSIADGSNAAPADAQCIKTLHVRRAIHADSRHDQRVAIEQLQVVRDITRAAAKFTAYARHQKCDIDLVQLVGQQCLGEATVERHDGIEGHGAADQGSHVVVFIGG